MSLWARMSPTLTGYLMRELVKAVALALLLFSFVLLVGFSYKTMRDGAGVVTMVKILPALLPLISPLVLPLAIITGILIAYGRFSSDSEYIAAQAGGIRPLWMAFPAFLLAVVAVFLTLFLNEFALGRAVRHIHSAVLADKTAIIARRLSRPGSLTQRTETTVYAVCRLPEDDRDRAGLDLVYFAMPKPGDVGDGQWDPAYPRPTQRLIARDHHLEAPRRIHGRLTLPIHLEGAFTAKLTQKDVNRIDMGEAGEGRIDLELEGRDDVWVSAKRMDYWSILYLDQMRLKAALEAELRRGQLEAVVAAGAPPETVDHYRRGYEDELENYYERHAELNHKLALSVSCIGFALLGVPLGLRAKRRGVAAGFMLGTVVALVYFVVLYAARRQVGQGVSSVIQWIPNLALVVIAGYYWWRQYRLD